MGAPALPFSPPRVSLPFSSSLTWYQQLGNKQTSWEWVVVGTHPRLCEYTNVCAREYVCVHVNVSV